MASSLSLAAAFIRLGRPLFLVGGFLFHGLGAAVAAYAGAAVDWVVLAWGQIAITATQLMTHYSNDYFDIEADRANATPTRWSGGSRVLVHGEVPPSAALGAALVLGAAALGAVGVLHGALRAPPAATAMLLLSLVLAWGYSAPPLRLHSRGLGELTTAVIVTGLWPLVGFSLQAGGLAAAPLLALAPLACLQFAMLLAIELPDAAGDEAAGKRTLVVWLGAPAATRLYIAVMLAAYGALPLLVIAGLPAAVAAAAGVTAPIAAFQVWRAARGAWREPSRWEGFTFRAVAMLTLTAAAELAAFVAITRAP